MGVYAFFPLLTQPLFEVGTDNIFGVLLFGVGVGVKLSHIPIEGAEECIFLFLPFFEFFAFVLFGLQECSRLAMVFDGIFDSLDVLLDDFAFVFVLETESFVLYDFLLFFLLTFLGHQYVPTI